MQDIADFTGDSLALDKIAVNTDEEVIVFCGVRFMAETIAILNPDKVVLMPQKENPNKKFYLPSPLVVCQDMKLTKLENVVSAL